MRNPQARSAGSGLAAVFGMEDAARHVYTMLHTILHRGSDGAGIAAANGQKTALWKKQGLLSRTLQEEDLANLDGTMALGHVLMAPYGSSASSMLQPLRIHSFQGDFALVMCGQPGNARMWMEKMEAEGLLFQSASGAEILAHLIQKGTGKLSDKIAQACMDLKGPYAFVLMTKSTLYAWRSADGIQPLFIAKTPTGWAFASEDAAFGQLETLFVQEAVPGTLMQLGKNRQDLLQLQKNAGHVCSMEAVYYARCDSSLGGVNIHQLREHAGIRLAAMEDVDADMVLAVPDTAVSAAMGFAAALHKPYEIGLILNRYLADTRIQPTRSQHEQDMPVRINAISSIVKGKDIYLVDDSVQKGHTARHVCRLLKAAGARSVHLRIASPPISHACLYGAEYIEEDQLAAASFSLEDLQALFEADSLRFLSLSDFKDLMPCSVCTRCFEQASGRSIKKGW